MYTDNICASVNNNEIIDNDQNTAPVKLMYKHGPPLAPTDTSKGVINFLLVQHKHIGEQILNMCGYL